MKPNIKEKLKELHQTQQELTQQLNRVESQMGVANQQRELITRGLLKVNGAIEILNELLEKSVNAK